MQKQTIGHIEIFWDGMRLAIRWQRSRAACHVLLIYALALGILAVVIWGYGDLRHWFPKLPAFTLTAGNYFSSTCILWLSLINLLSEKVMFDPLTKHLQHKRWMEGEEGTLGWTEVRPNGQKHWAIILLHADGQKIWKTTGCLNAFRNQTEAQKVADILNKFLSPLEVKETPGVWAPRRRDE